MTTPSYDGDPQQGPRQPQPYPHYTDPVSGYPVYPPLSSPTAHPAAPFYYGYGSPAPQAPAPRKGLWRAMAAGAVAGAVLTAAIAIPTTIAISDHTGGASSSASAGTLPQAPSGDGGSTGDDPFGSLQDPFSQGDGSGSTGGSTTQQSGTNATDAQSAGVVLVDTVLTGGAGAGTGIVIDADGLVLTNYHVVESSTAVKVTVASTGKTYDATVVGRDKSADVALLKLSGASDLETAKIDADGVDVKQAVTAVGNASGQGFLSAVTGTVTAEDQHITASEGGGPFADSEALTGLIETDAAVVPGYSGGPLLDADGEVIGIDVAASTSTSAMGASQNTGEAYAIPIQSALTIAEQIENGDESGSVQIGPSAFLGVGIARQSGSNGAVLGEVTADGPAAKAGLVAGDTVTKVDGTAVTTFDTLVDALATHEPGDKVSLTWTTAAGKAETATVTLGSSPLN